MELTFVFILDFRNLIAATVPKSWRDGNVPPAQAWFQLWELLQTTCFLYLHEEKREQIQEFPLCSTDFLWGPREAIPTLFLSSSSCKMELIMTNNVFHKVTVRIK